MFDWGDAERSMALAISRTVHHNIIAATPALALRRASGVRHELKQFGVNPAASAAPTCQTCHMPNGDHEVQTAWGFLAVRLPMPEDKQWAADRATILQALGVLDPSGKPAP
jgi:hypothetical protein